MNVPLPLKRLIISINKLELCMIGFFSKIILWPSKELRLKTMPMCFRTGEFMNTTAIWDCFEIETDTTYTPSDQAGSFSYNKQRPTDKIFISITPESNSVSNSSPLHIVKLGLTPPSFSGVAAIISIP